MLTSQSSSKVTPVGPGLGSGTGDAEGRGLPVMRSLSIPTDVFTAGSWGAGVPRTEGSSSPFSPFRPPSLCLLLLFLQKHSLSGLISSICCNHEQIQITTFPCVGHMSLLRTEVALSLPHRDNGECEEREKLENKLGGRSPDGKPGRPWVLCLAFGAVASAVQRPACRFRQHLLSPPPPAPAAGCSLAVPLISTWRCLT